LSQDNTLPALFDGHQARVNVWRCRENSVHLYVTAKESDAEGASLLAFDGALLTVRQAFDLSGKRFAPLYAETQTKFYFNGDSLAAEIGFELIEPATWVTRE
jgi:hypothetical protein